MLQTRTSSDGHLPSQCYFAFYETVMGRSLLRAFGEAVFWQPRDHFTLAPPWVSYAELLNRNDPRAHEAASQLQQDLSL